MCKHNHMRFENGKLICIACGADNTPRKDEFEMVSFIPNRAKLIDALIRSVSDLTDTDLHEVELYAEFLKRKR